MAVYLYNLLFSLTGTDFTLGRFTQYNTAIANPTISDQSCAWFTYLTAGVPPGLGDWYTPITTALAPGSWGNCQQDTGSLSLEPGDYLAMRVASLDANAGSYLVRVTGVFGRGTSQLEIGGDDLQSPLQMSTSTTPNTNPRAVIDVDGSSGPSWPGPITSDNSWVSWLGAAHTPSNAAANDYTLNVGISVYAGGAYHTFGRDPRVHVGGTMKHKRKDCAA
ncbi:MAG TPA: hypothetical protein VK763_04655 [Terriglobales bacterium]|jgi:hypothetical protein|nr:hypothetical protein [Terriglobales bacterium]